MDMQHERDGGVDTLTLIPERSPLLVFFSVLCVVAILAMLLTIASRPVSYTLMAVLAVTAACLGRLAMVSFELLAKTTLRLDAGGVHISRLFGGESYPWDAVEGLKMVPSLGSLNDKPNSDPASRLGIGLFLKSGKDRAHDLDPDIMLLSASEKAEKMIDRAVNIATASQIRNGGAPPARLRGAGGRSTPAQFRRSGAAPDAPASDAPARMRGAGFGRKEH